MVPKVIDVLFDGRIVKGGDRHRALVLAQKGPYGIEEQVDSSEVVRFWVSSSAPFDKDPPTSFGPAAGLLGGHSRPHLIHCSLKFSLHLYHFLLHLPHHLLDLSVAYNTVISGEYARRLFDPLFNLVDLATCHCYSPFLHRGGRASGRTRVAVRRWTALFLKQLSWGNCRSSNKPSCLPWPLAWGRMARSQRYTNEHGYLTCLQDRH
jgi:hypothetical protein